MKTIRFTGPALLFAASLASSCASTEDETASATEAITTRKLSSEERASALLWEMSAWAEGRTFTLEQEIEFEAGGRIGIPVVWRGYELGTSCYLVNSDVLHERSTARGSTYKVERVASRPFEGLRRVGGWQFDFELTENGLVGDVTLSCVLADQELGPGVLQQGLRDSKVIQWSNP